MDIINEYDYNYNENADDQYIQQLNEEYDIYDSDIHNTITDIFFDLKEYFNDNSPFFIKNCNILEFSNFILDNHFIYKKKSNITLFNNYYVLWSVW